MCKNLVLWAFAMFLVSMVRAGAEVVISQSPDKSVSIRTSTYTAQFDDKGNLTNLIVKGCRAFGHQFGEPGKPPSEAATVSVRNKMVAVRSGNMRDEWTFAEESIHLLTEGYSFECQLDPDLKAVVVPGGKGGAPTEMFANTSALVMQNGLTISYSPPLHAGGKRMVPTAYCNGTKKPGDLLEYDLKLGAPVAAVELLSAITISADGSSYGSLLDGGNQGWGMVHFPDPGKIAFKTAQKNLGAENMALEYRMIVLDHRIAGREIASQAQKTTIAPNGSVEQSWTVGKLAPGFYYLTVSAYKGDTKLTDVKQAFTVDLDHYSHPLTRPADFKAFWDRQNRRLAGVPMNPKVTLISTPDNPNKAYEVYLDLLGGEKLHGLLQVPEKVGKAPSQFGSLLAGPLKAEMDKARRPDYKPTDYVQFTTELPEDGTYTRWVSAEDNNLHQCIMAWLRGIDFLATQPKVNPARIMTVGASRTGGLTIIAAALRPKNVCAANGFVQTSCGLSWTDKLYSGWGKSPDPNDAVSFPEFCFQASFLDPVNFAPDVKCPAILAYGIDDDLSPPQGIEAAYHALGSKWKRISRDSGGHQCSKGCQQIQQDMLKVLEAEGTGLDQTRTLKDH